MNRTLVCLTGISLLASCSNNYNPISTQEKPNYKDQRAPESEFRSSPPTYHEKIQPESIPKKEKTIDDEYDKYMDRHPSLWKQKLKAKLA